MYLCIMCVYMCVFFSCKHCKDISYHWLVLKLPPLPLFKDNTGFKKPSLLKGKGSINVVYVGKFLFPFLFDMLIICLVHCFLSMNVILKLKLIVLFLNQTFFLSCGCCKSWLLSRALYSVSPQENGSLTPNRTGNVHA